MKYSINFPLCTITTVITLLSFGLNFSLAQETWYTTRTHKTQQWNDQYAWTKDPAGTLPTTHEIPQAGDHLVILAGQSMLLDNEVVIRNYGQLSIRENALLFYKSETLNTPKAVPSFTSIIGKGKLKIDSSDIPSGDMTIMEGFANKNQGTLVVVNQSSGSSIVFSQSLNISSLEKDGDGIVRFNDNLHLKDNLKVTKGEIEINTNAIYVEGNVLLNPRTRITQKNTSTLFTFEGDFLSEGRVQIRKGRLKAVGARKQYLYVKGNKGKLLLRDLVIEKTNKNDSIQIKADVLDAIQLSGTNNGGSTHHVTDYTLVDRFNFALESGTAILKENINFELCESGGTSRALRRNSSLVVDGAQLSMQGNGLVIFGDLEVRSGTFDALPISYGLIIRKAGVINVKGGDIMAQAITTSFDVDHLGGYIQSGGRVTLKYSHSDFIPFVLPYKTNTFSMSGGEIIFDVATFNSSVVEGMLIRSEVSNITGGAIVVKTAPNTTFNIASSSPFYNVRLEGSGTVSTEARDLYFFTEGIFGSLPKQYPLKVLGNLEVEATFYAYGQDVEIGKQLKVSSPDAFCYRPTETEEGKKNKHKTIFNGTEQGSIFVNHKTDWKNTGTDSSPDNEYNLYHIVIDKTGTPNEENIGFANNIVKLLASDWHNKATVNLDEYKAKRLINKLPEQQNESNLLRIGDLQSASTEGTLEIKNGILYPNNYSIRLYCNTIIGENGQLGYYNFEENDKTSNNFTSVNALVKFRPSEQLVQVEKGAKLGNIKINSGGESVRFTDDILIQRIFYRHGNIIVGKSKIEIERFDAYLSSKGDEYNSFGRWYRHINDNQPTSQIFNNYIQTLGKESDGGLSLKVWKHSNFTIDGDGNYQLVFPIGLENTADNLWGYFPANVTIENTGVLKEGYITAKIIKNKLALAANNDVEDHYWQISKSGFEEGLPSVKVDVYNKSTSNYSNWKAGRILNGDNEIQTKYGLNSPFQRQSFDNKIVASSPADGKVFINGPSGGNTREMRKITFDIPWGTISNIGFTSLYNTYLSAGTQAAFTGTPDVYYWRYNGNHEENNARAWKNKNHWLKLQSDGSLKVGSSYNDYPQVADVVYFDFDKNNIGSGQIAGIRIPAGQTVEAAQINFIPGYKGGQNKTFRILIYEGATLNAAVVKGAGEILVRHSNANQGHLVGDFGEWASHKGSRYNARIQDRNTILREHPTIKRYPEFYINSKNGSDHVATINYDLYARKLTLAHYAGLEIYSDASRSGHLYIKDTIQVGRYQQGRMFFRDGGNQPREIHTGTFLVSNPDNSQGSFVKTIGTNKVQHQLFIKKDLIVGEGSWSKTYINFRGDVNVKTIFVGSTNSKVYVKGTKNKTVHQMMLADVEIQKDHLEDTVAFTSSPIQFSSNRIADNADKSLVMTKGTLLLDDENLSLDLNAGGGNFILPENTKLVIKNGAEVITSSSENLTGGIQLGGAIEVKGGKLLLDKGAFNFIEYLNTGKASILVESGELTVGGQIRATEKGNIGPLSFIQRGGSVNIGGQVIPTLYNQNSVFELVDEGASLILNFKNDPTAVFRIRGGEGLGTSTPLINIAKANIGYDEEAVFDIVPYDGFKTFKVNAVEMPFTRFGAGTITFLNPKVNIGHGFLIHTGATFDQQQKQITFKSTNEVINRGTWNATKGKVIFNGEKEAFFKGNGVNIMNDFKVNVPKLNLLVEKDLELHGELFINTGNQLILSQSDIRILGVNTKLFGEVVSRGAIDRYLMFRGTDIQYLNATGASVDNLQTFNRAGLVLKNSSPKKNLYSLSILKNLDLIGILNIGKNKLYLGKDFKFTDTANFGVNGRMITVDGNRRDGGIIKKFAMSDPHDFIFPIGIGQVDHTIAKYTPITFKPSHSVSNAHEFSIKVLPFENIYPGLIKSGVTNPRLLNFTWFLHSLDDNGKEQEVPNGFDATFEAKYQDADINGNECEYVTAVLYEEALNWQIDKDEIFDKVNCKGIVKKNPLSQPEQNIVSFKTKKTVLSQLNNGSLTGVYTIGHPDDMVIEIKKFISAEGMSSNAVWSNSSNWLTQKIVRDVGNDYVDPSTGIHYPRYREDGYEVTPTFPTDGSFVHVRKGHTLTFDVENADLSEAIICGTLIMNNGKPQDSNPIQLIKFGKIEGSGTVELVSTNTLPEGNKDLFYNIDSGVVHYNLNLTTSNVSAPFLVDSDISEIRGLRFSYDTNNGSIYYNIGSNLIIGNQGLTIDKRTVVETSNSNTSITNKGDFTINSGGHLKLTSTNTLVNEGNMNLINKANISNQGRIEVQGNFVADAAVNNRLKNEGEFAFTGTGNQHIQGNNFEFNHLIIDKTQAGSIVTFDQAAIVNGVLSFGLDNKGLIQSNNGNLKILRPKDMENFGASSYILGTAQFVFDQSLSAEYVILPVGCTNFYAPTAITLQQGATSRDVTWSVSYEHDPSNTETPVSNLPNIVDINQQKLTALQKNGKWHIIPDGTDEVEAYVWLYIGKVLSDYPKLKREDFRPVFIDQTSDLSVTDYKILGGTVSQFIGTNSIKSSRPLKFKGNQIIIEYVNLSSSARTTNSYLTATMNNDGMSWGSIGNTTELPVELISFSAEREQENIELRWSTATEINNKGFYVEHSTDLRSWKEIGFIEGVGNSQTTQHYNFIDDKPIDGKNYYRLKQIDLDGKQETFGPLLVLFSDTRTSKTPTITTFPTPTVGNKVNLKFTDFDEQIKVQVIDSKGYVMLYETFDPMENTLLQLDVSKFTSGIYFIKAIFRNKQLVYGKILIQK